MSKEFVVQTKAVVVYDNWVEVDEDDIEEYRATDPAYAELSDEDIVALMYSTGDVYPNTSEPIDWLAEEVMSAREE